MRKFLICILSFVCLSAPNLIFSAERSCRCEFDNQAYQAFGYFSGACSYVMDAGRKKCALRRAGDFSDVAKELIKPRIFGYPDNMNQELSVIDRTFNSKPDEIALIKPINFFAFLLRPSYLAAPFLTDRQKAAIDGYLVKIVEAHGREMQQIFAGTKGKKVFKGRGMPGACEMVLEKGSVRLTVKTDNGDILLCGKII